jgi:membrane-associated protease RseP (regulator of RpoE activity)
MSELPISPEPIPQQALRDAHPAPLPILPLCTVAPQTSANGDAPTSDSLVPNVVDELQLEQPQPHRRRVWAPLMLFLATCFTTFYAGCYGWEVAYIDSRVAGRIAHNWRQGLTYMACVLGMLLAHEMGHFLMTVRYRIRASFPIFIPVPFTMTGTMGAVIRMDGLRANRRELFDIGLAGPLAGLVVALPLVYFGLKTWEPPDYRAVLAAVHENPDGQATYGKPVLVQLMLRWERPDLPADIDLTPNALYMAGWVGLLVTGLNMLPMSQLDGGHIIHALFGPKGRWVARGFLLSAIIAVIVTENYNWLVMLCLITFLGVDHPPSANDQMPLGKLRWCLGLASLAIPIFCFMPTPIS